MSVRSHLNCNINTIYFINRIDRYRPKGNQNSNSDVEFEFHIYFDDAFKDNDNGRHANEYAETLVEVITEVYT